MNKKFFTIIEVVVILFVFATLAFADGGNKFNYRTDYVRSGGNNYNNRDGNHRGNRRVVTVQNEYRGYHGESYRIGSQSPNAVEVGGTAVGSLEPTEPFLRIFGVVIIGRSSGHWEDKIVGYQPVLLHYPAVLGRGHWTEDGRFVQFVLIPAHDEYEQRPIFQRVWVS